MSVKSGFSNILKYLLGILPEEEKPSVWNSPQSRQMLQEQWANDDFDRPAAPDLDKMYRKIVNGISESGTFNPAAPKPGSAVLFIRLLAQTAMVFLLLFFSLRLLSWQNMASEGQLPAMLETVASAEQRARLILPDHTMVWLNGGSSLYYPEKFQPGERRVYLIGEAFFDVDAHPGQPFRVSTGNTEILVSGTRFNVCDYPNDPVAKTILVDGRVEAGRKGNSLFYVLEPDQQWSLVKESQETSISIVASEEYTAWINGKMIFSAELLEDICRRLGNWYGVEIRIADELKERYHLTLTVRDESVETIISLIARTIPFTWESIDNKTILLESR